MVDSTSPPKRLVSASRSGLAAVAGGVGVLLFTVPFGVGMSLVGLATYRGATVDGTRGEDSATTAP